MKKLLLSAAVALAITGPAFADDACAGFEKLAEAIVTSKQIGVPMSQTIATINDTTPDPDARKIMRALVIDAYRLPDFSSEEYKRRQIVEFRNAVSSACYSGLIAAGALD